MNAVTKAQIADHLSEKQGIMNKREAKDFVDAFFEKLRAALEDGEQVKLSGFGNFDLRDKKPRPGRNPKTGSKVEVPAKHVPHFKAGKELRERVDLV